MQHRTFVVRNVFRGFGIKIRPRVFLLQRYHLTMNVYGVSLRDNIVKEEYIAQYKAL